MSRTRLAVMAFTLGIIAAPWGVRIVESCFSPALAQERDDFNETEPELNRRPGGDRGNQDLIVVDQRLDQADSKSIYLELCKQKVQLLTAEALEREIESLQQELVELEASQKLRTAERQLQLLINEHPQSRAAGQARTMLESMRQPRGQGKNVPLPGDDFGGEDVFTRGDDSVVPARRSPTRQPTYDAPRK